MYCKRRNIGSSSSSGGGGGGGAAAAGGIGIIPGCIHTRTKNIC